jgi:hypothetical protein
LQKQNNKTAMEATAGKYVVEVEDAYIVPTPRGWNAIFEITYDERVTTITHPFNYPYIVEDHRKCLDNGDHEAARQVLMDELWIEIDEKVAAHLDDLHQAETVTTPRQKRDARYEAEN